MGGGCGGGGTTILRAPCTAISATTTPIFMAPGIFSSACSSGCGATRGDAFVRVATGYGPIISSAGAPPCGGPGARGGRGRSHGGGVTGRACRAGRRGPRRARALVAFIPATGSTGIGPTLPEASAAGGGQASGGGAAPARALGRAGAGGRGGLRPGPVGRRGDSISRASGRRAGPLSRLTSGGP